MGRSGDYAVVEGGGAFDDAETADTSAGVDT